MATPKDTPRNPLPQPAAGELVGRYLEFLGMVPHVPGRPGRPRGRWLLRCHGCGREVERVPSLVVGLAHSCGCKQREMQREAVTTHGASRAGNVSAEYVTFKSMVARCCNPKNKAYHRYGGRGITICDAWRHDFAAFLAHIGPKPSPDHSVDRIDNAGNYEPGNVRWSTRVEQASNRRSSRLHEYQGRSQTVAAWARELGINRTTLAYRLDTGQDIATALTGRPDRRFAIDRRKV